MENNYRVDFNHALSSREQNPEAAIKGMSQARDVAKQAGDDRFVLYANHWIMQTQINTARTFVNTLELAIETAIEARKPKYQDVQEHICVYQDLIGMYCEIDPLGYAKQIEEAIDYMASEITTDIQCKSCLQDLKVTYEIISGQLDTATDTCQKYIAIADRMWSRQHHHAIAYYHLCNIAFLNADWTTFLEYAKVALEKIGASRSLVTCRIFIIAGSALAHRKLGNDVQARQYYYQAISAAQDTGAMMRNEYFEALCQYHEMADELVDSLKVTEHHINFLETRGQFYAEAKARAHQCKLLKKLGQPFENERKAAEAICKKLQNPQSLLDELRALDD